MPHRKVKNPKSNSIVEPLLGKRSCGRFEDVRSSLSPVRSSLKAKTLASLPWLILLTPLRLIDPTEHASRELKLSRSFATFPENNSIVELWIPGNSTECFLPFALSDVRRIVARRRAAVQAQLS